MNMRPHQWHRHPGVRSGDQLTPGERAADAMRNGMGSWIFVFGACGFLAVWMVINVIAGRHGGHTFDAYPFILLNLVLSCVAAMQGAILLIAAKRSDQVASELAAHNYETNVGSRQVLDEHSGRFDAQDEHLDRQDARLDVQDKLMAELKARVEALTAPPVAGGTP